MLGRCNKAFSVVQNFFPEDHIHLELKIFMSFPQNARYLMPLEASFQSTLFSSTFPDFMACSLYQAHSHANSPKVLRTISISSACAPDEY